MNTLACMAAHTRAHTLAHVCNTQATKIHGKIMALEQPCYDFPISG